MNSNIKTIQLFLIAIGIFLILATYIFYPKFNKEKLIKIELEKPENVARMNERLGEWAGSKLGKSEEEKKNYIQEIIKSDLEEAGQEDVFRKIKKDFQAASIVIEETEIRDQMKKAFTTVEDKIFVDGREGNAFENVEYSGTFNINNTFSVKSYKAHIFNDEPDIVYMNNMHVTLYMRDGRVITITSDEGIYDKSSYNCFFKKNVKATDGETIILSQNLDLLADEDYASVYNDVILTGDSGSLMADKVRYDFETELYEISMFSDKPVKVKYTK